MNISLKDILPSHRCRVAEPKKAIETNPQHATLAPQQSFSGVYE